MHIELQTKTNQPHKCVFSSYAFFSWFFSFSDCNFNAFFLLLLMLFFLLSFFSISLYLSFTRHVIYWNEFKEPNISTPYWMNICGFFWWDSTWNPFGIRYVSFFKIIRCLFASVAAFFLSFSFDPFSANFCIRLILSIAYLFFGFFLFDPYLLITFWCIRFNQIKFLIFKRIQLEKILIKPFVRVVHSLFWILIGLWQN